MVKVKKSSSDSPKKKGLKTYRKKILKFTKHPEKFLEVQENVAEGLKMVIKGIYDRGNVNPFITKEGHVPFLDELVIEEMHDEQIWQQLDLKNDFFLERDMKEFLEELPNDESEMHLNFTSNAAAESDDALSGGDDASDSEEENSVNNDGLDSDDDMHGKESKKAKKQKKKNKKDKHKAKARASVVDDQFFKLDDMARFLDEEDERERMRQNGLAEKNPLIELDYFDEHTGKEDEEDAADIKYSDFFDDEDSEDEEDEEDDDEEEEAEEDEGSEGAGDEEESDVEQDQDQENGKPEDDDELSDEAEVERNRKLRFEIYKSEGGGGGEGLEDRPAKKQVIEQPDSSDSEEDEDVIASNGLKSSHEIRQEKLNEKISKMESQLLKEKPWQLKGEISADTRPQNSLLEEVLDYEHTTRPAPAISEETTVRLEDIIKQRIRNKAFDDVERKVRPPDNPREYRKQLVLDGEKSKESLAKVYEQDYLKQLEKANPDAADPTAEEEEPKEHKEIRRMMKTVLAQLDALSNYHYTPRPAAPELKILTNTPAISMEEVAPVATSDATLLAPEEVHRRPKGDVMSKDERTKTDQNRERRLKKRFQQQKFRREAEREQKQLEKAGNSNSKQNRALQTSLLKKVTKAKNVQQMTESSAGPGKSSSAFFSQLQDEVRSQVKAKAEGVVKKKKKDTGNLKATSFKL